MSGDMLSIGATGVRAYQTALTTVSENIANASTAGYTRRAASIHEVVATSSTTRTVTGLGVVVSGVTRSADAARSADVREAGADLAKTTTSAAWLTRIENGLSSNQLGDRITDFFNAATAVAADPSATATRATMLESASSVAQAFASTGNALEAAAQDLDSAADGAVNQLNGLSVALAKVNAGLGRTQPGTSTAAGLLDLRDQLLETMSALTDTDVSFDAAGRATVRAGGGGPILVQGENAAIVTYVRNDEGAASFAAHLNGETATMSPNGGALAGMAEGAQRIAGMRTDLNTLATNFAAGVNAVQAQGRDLDGNAGAPIFAAGDSPTDLSLALTDPRGIAAASTGGSIRDNSNLTALATLRTAQGYETKLSNMTASNAATLQARNTVADAQSSIRDSAVAARDAVSGVNVDEEAVDLLRFQQAYQASSRVIQIARETLQSILDIR